MSSAASASPSPASMFVFGGGNVDQSSSAAAAVNSTPWNPAPQVTAALSHSLLDVKMPHVWVRGCRIDPLRFLAGWRKRRLN